MWRRIIPPVPAGRGIWRRLALYLAIMGPGMITGIVDDDPTGITGYSLAGAHFGYSMLWALVLCTISLAVVQEMVARMGAITGKGLADLIRERFGVAVAMLAMVTLFATNLATTVAEFAGVAGASEIFGISRYISVPVAAGVVFMLVAYGSYRKVELVLLVFSLVFVSYIMTGFIAGPHWPDVARGAFVPTMKFNLPFLTVLISLIGTTITPWGMFFNQSTVVDKGLGERDARFASLDAISGSVVTNLIAFFIIVTTAATLWVGHQPADTVEQVSHSLHPLAGSFASQLFAIGLLNAAIMAMAVLPLSTAYAICESFGWERSVSRGVRQAPVFFGIFGGLLIVGALSVLVPGVPLVFLLILPNVVGAILLPVILVLALKLINDRRLMGRWVNSRTTNLIAWSTTAVLVALSGIYLVVAILQAAGVLSS